MIDLIEKHGIEVHQLYQRADGTDEVLEVVDTTTYRHCSDVVVRDIQKDYRFRIDAFKLAVTRYTFTGYYVQDADGQLST